MAHYKVEICGINTSKLPLLSNEEKKTLFDKIKKGDKKAREAYIHGNLRLVLSIIQRFNNSTENVDDLFQIGCIGLMKAIDNFDVTQNVKFSTYAVPMIIGEVRRYLRDNNAIRVSRSLRDTAYKAIYAKEALMKKQETEPTLEEISKVIDVPPKDIVFALDAIQSPVSLYEPVYSEGGDTLYVMDQISDKKKQGIQLGRTSLLKRRIEPSAGTGKPHYTTPLSGRENTNGSGKRNPYFSGTGLTTGKKRPENHEKSLRSIK